MTKSKTKFVYVAGDDEGVDGEYELHLNGKPTGIGIQDCRTYAGDYGVYRFSGRTLTILGDTKSLKTAKEIALKSLVTK